MATYKDGYDSTHGYNRNAWANLPPHLKVIGAILQGVTAPIGLASEAIAHSKAKKRATTDTEVISEPPVAEVDAREPAFVQRTQTNLQRQTDIELDEADWALDEVVTAGIDGETEADGAGYDGRERIEHSTNGATSSTRRQSRLPFPAILPQRRPGTKTRGFVRAYAPVLEDSGIDQAMFLSFLKDFHTASQASPIFDIIVLASAIAGLYPNGIAQAVTITMQTAARAGAELQERWRTNRFLDQANKEIFMPRGLYALIVAYKPVNETEEDHVESRTIDFGAMAMLKYGGDGAAPANAGESGSPETTKMKAKMQRLRVASGQSHGEAEMPMTCAPLVFPALEAATNQGANPGEIAGLRARTKGAGKFIDDYFDRRAQAEFNTDHSATTLAKMRPTPAFASPMADPRDARNTHLITLITGGKIKAEPLGGRRRWEKAQRQAAERRAEGLKTKSVRRGLKEDVLYLMVVNVPTERELEEARREVREAKERRRGGGGGGGGRSTGR